VTEVDGRYLVSNSEVQAFLGCPRRWWLSWHRGLRPAHERVDGVRSTGARTHAALAELYAPGGSEAAARAALVTAQDVDLAAAITVNDRVENTSEGDPYDIPKLHRQFELERVMITGYLEWLADTGADSDLRVYATETYVEAEFTPTRGGALSWDMPVVLIGKLDARAYLERTGRRVFIDYKTGEMPARQLLQINPQMLHYHLLELGQPGLVSRCDGALYTVLRRVLRTRQLVRPAYQREAIYHNTHQLASYRLQLEGTITRMLNARTYLLNGADHRVIVPPRSSRDCTWICPFFKNGICGMLDDGSRAEDAIAERCVAGDPLAYYDDDDKEREVGE
jgi:RecB family exonuclease